MKQMLVFFSFGLMFGISALLAKPNPLYKSFIKNELYNKMGYIPFSAALTEHENADNFNVDSEIRQIKEEMPLQPLKIMACNGLTPIKEFPAGFISTNTTGGIYALNNLVQDFYGIFPTQFGINLVNTHGNIGVFCCGAMNKSLYNNKVTGFNSTAPNTVAIVVDESDLLWVSCNETAQTLNGIEFSQFQVTVVFENNLMNDSHTFGYVLSNNGIIFPQSGNGGFGVTLSDNQWLGTWDAVNNWMTLADNSNSTFSPLWVRPAPASYNPDGFGTAVSGTAYSFGSGSVVFPGYNPPITACPMVYPSFAPPQDWSVWEQIAGRNYPYYGDVLAAQFNTEWALYQSLSEQPQYRDSSVVLDSFYIAHSNLTFGRIQAIDSLIAQADWTGANAIVQAFTPTDIRENNLKLYYSLLIKSQNTALTSTDSSDLYNLALQCPTIGGNIIHAVRNFYLSYYHTYQWFEDNCEQGEGGNAQIGGYERLSKSQSTTNYAIFPNPNNGAFIIQTKDEVELLLLQIKDINGKVVANREITINARQGKILLNLSKGLYLIQLTNPINNENYTQKLFIY